MTPDFLSKIEDEVRRYGGRIDRPRPSRFAYVEYVGAPTGLGDSADYLRLVGVNSNTLTFGE